MTNWRERLNVRVPDAEDQLMIALQNRKLLRHMEVKDTVILFYTDRIELVHKDKVTPEMIDESEGYTIPDALLRHNGLHPIYLDGPPHKRDGIRERDEWVNMMLRTHGIEPWRYSYRNRLPKYMLKQIVERIEGVLNGK